MTVRTMRGDEVVVGDVILTGQREWTVTGISPRRGVDGMFVFYVTPERHKPIHTNPGSTWRVRRQPCPPHDYLTVPETVGLPTAAPMVSCRRCGDVGWRIPA